MALPIHPEQLLSSIEIKVQYKSPSRVDYMVRSLVRRRVGGG